MKIVNPHNVSLTGVHIIGSGTLILGAGCEIRLGTVLEFGGGTLVMKPRSVIGYNSMLQITGDIHIGTGSLLGPHTIYISSSHKIDPKIPLVQMPLIKGVIRIEDNVWIGGNCTINYNVRIGSSSIIGANSFVNKDVPEKEIWGGSPAKFIRKNI